MANTLTKIVKNLPDAPGVYQMKDAKGAILYVGKAKNLKKRVSSYFRENYEHSTRTRKLMEAVKDIAATRTDTELEALLLETNLIKEHRPKYNILMKDDKSYVYVAVNLAEDFPRIRVVREKDLPKHRSPKVKLFGPKLASGRVYETLRILKKLFPFRHCNLDIEWKGGASPESDPLLLREGDQPGAEQSVSVTNRVIDFPCLDYSIKRCPGPCIGAVKPNEYKKIVQQIMAFLGGETEVLENSLKEEMKEAAGKKLFEKAARIRDKLKALEGIGEKQKVTDLERRDTDVINFTAELGRVYFNVFMIRGGKLISSENFVLDALEMKQPDVALALSEVLESFLTQYYEKAAEIPREILIPEALENGITLESWLSQKSGVKVQILNPKKGEKIRLLELSQKNAEHFAKQERIRWMSEQRGETALARLAEALGMKEAPKRIEGYDISHLAGNETVGSMVVFENGLPKSADYRHFKIRTISGKPDDYRCMEEIMMRRLKYLSKPQNVSLRKASKKDIALIRQWGKTEDWKNFQILHQNKKAVGMVRLLELTKGIFEISALYINPAFRDNRLSYTLLGKLIERVKNKKARFYISVKPDEKDHYLNFGFFPIRDFPKVIKPLPDGTPLAYYKAKRPAADASFSAKPDLIVIDGGKGQLGTAMLALKRLKLDIPVISLAKRLEEIFLPGKKAPLLLEEGDEALKLLQRIRDESHRFAITFQRNLRGKKMLE